MVIAIIAILAALLLPAPNKVKVKAEGVSCLNNLHQMGVAWFMYNDGCFSTLAAADTWNDLPASYHNGACGFAFADAHDEIRKWKDASTRQPITKTDWGGSLQALPPNDRHLQWILERTYNH